MLAEGRLHGMKIAIFCETFDGQDFRTFGLSGKHGARLHRAAIDMNDAGAALARVAADMRAGETKLIADELDKQRSRLDVGASGLAVDRHGNNGHATYLP
jgi:hypothetical protein